MGLKALVDYAIIKDLCEKVKRDQKTFTGKVKSKLDKHARPADTIEKVDEVKRLLLSTKRKNKSKKTSSKRKRSGATKLSTTFRQSGASGSAGSEDSDFGDSKSSGSSKSSDDSSSSASTNTGESGDSDEVNDLEGPSK